MKYIALLKIKPVLPKCFACDLLSCVSFKFPQVRNLC